MSRGVDGRVIYIDDSDRDTFLRMLMQLKASHGFRLFAYCLMSNHFHLLIQIGEQPLYSGMHQFLTRYSHYFNRRHSRPGHLFQSRYTAPDCRKDSYLENLIRYIHMNPVRAGLAESPESWPWSGHCGFVGLTHDPLLDQADLAALRGQNLGELRQQYIESLRSPIPAPDSRHLIERPDLGTLAAAVAREHGLAEDDLGRRGKRFTRAKLALIATATQHGYSLAAVAAAIGCSRAAVSQLDRRRSLRCA